MRSRVGTRGPERPWWHVVPLAGVAMVVVIGGGTTVSAHPLGNFSVNHLNALTFEADRVVNDAIVDMAEIPTAQEQSAIDANGDGTVTDAERARYAEVRCAALALGQTLRIDGMAVPLSVETTSFVFVPGEAGLPTGRLECELVAPTDLSVARSVEFDDAFDPGRVGWHEITAVGIDVAIVDSPVAAISATDGLRSYPVDLLSSPLDVRSASFDVRPAVGTSTPVPSPGSNAPDVTPTDRFGIVPGVFDGVTSRFDDLIGRRDLTLGVGLLAVGLALVLGASHAVLPGHGKTVMAAYIAGRQGSISDAVVVGATVTGTHTGGVLLLGLALTLSTTLAGEAVIGWLGVASGLLVAGLGVGFLVGLVRRRATGGPAVLHGHSHGFAFAHHHHDHDHDHDHDHHDHDHDHHDHDHHDHDHDHDHDHHDHDHDHHDHDHDHPDPSTTRPERRFSRRGLVGMGIAGGLVPSPSALIVLLSAVALGRTAFGVLLVIAYGVGMAFTLTLAGIALVVVRDRYQRRAITAAGRIRTMARRWTAIAPYGTAVLVVVVGLGLAIRSLSTVAT